MSLNLLFKPKLFLIQAESKSKFQMKNFILSLANVELKSYEIHRMIGFRYVPMLFSRDLRQRIKQLNQWNLHYC